MKILFFCSPQSNQRALAHKIAANLPLAGIVTVVPRPDWTRRRSNSASRLRAFTGRLASASIGLPLRRAWFGMLAHYAARYPAFPVAPKLQVTDINSPEALDLVERERPDLVVVSGTNLLKPPLIERIHRTGKVMNLHTGISPYVKGGPNCTNWCLALGRFDLIGNTVMWIDAGIDSGNLIATERTPLTGDESLAQIHIAVMDHAHALCARCVKLILDGAETSNVPQAEIGPGTLYRLRDWTPERILWAVWNHARHYGKDTVNRADRTRVLLVSPTQGVAEAP